MTLLKAIPKVDKFVSNIAFDGDSKPLITSIAKDVLNRLRANILEKKIEHFEEIELINQVKKEYEKITKPSLQRVINATGVIVHTNLGRSLINEKAFEAAKLVATSYNNLEYDLEQGKRGERYSHITKVVTKLLGCEDVLIVNNNASAVFLVLNTFAKNKEVIVSRGELVEIGGSFRVPDVMSSSGAILKEIGTTNKTHARDYVNALNENTAMMMKVHKSNYSIEGFSSEVKYEEMVKIAKENSVIDYYDMGSGHLVDLPFGLSEHEPSVLKFMEKDPSLLSFSGDKLLGSVQAGIIVGKKQYIEQLKKNQLLRMLRVDKLTLALLEENFKSILLGNIDEIPTLKMLFKPLEEIKKSALELKSKIENISKCEVLETTTVIGGGTTPNRKIPTFVLTLEFKGFKPNKIEKLLREKNVIGRIENDKFLLDFRTIAKHEIELLENIIKEIINE